jgi:hypothetical protein
MVKDANVLDQWVTHVGQCRIRSGKDISKLVAEWSFYLICAVECCKLICLECGSHNVFRKPCHAIFVMVVEKLGIS